MIFAEPTDRASAFEAAVSALPPRQRDRCAEGRDVVQPPFSAAAGFGGHPAARTAGPGSAALHAQPEPVGEPALRHTPGDSEHMHAGKIEQGVDARAVAT